MLQPRLDLMVISGTGSVLDTMSAGAPLIVVANPTLKDNHQEELAEELQNQGYAIWGKLKYEFHPMLSCAVRSAIPSSPSGMSRPMCRVHLISSSNKTPRITEYCLSFQSPKSNQDQVADIVPSNLKYAVEQSEVLQQESGNRWRTKPPRDSPLMAMAISCLTPIKSNSQDREDKLTEGEAAHEEGARARMG